MKTVNLELSKQLKEAGFPQESQFKYCGGHMWYHDDPEGEGEFKECEYDGLLGEDEYCEGAGMTCGYFIASPTADEILDQLPESIRVSEMDYHIEVIRDGDKDWIVNYSFVKHHIGYKVNVSFSANTLADAAARSYIYLKKEGLI